MDGFEEWFPALARRAAPLDAKPDTTGSACDKYCFGGLDVGPLHASSIGRIKHSYGAGCVLIADFLRKRKHTADWRQNNLGKSTREHLRNHAITDFEFFDVLTDSANLAGTVTTGRKWGLRALLIFSHQHQRVGKVKTGRMIAD